MGQPFEDCPSFEACSCNVCPLDPLSALHGGPRVALPGEESCRATRAARERVAVAHGHEPAWALLPRELARARRRTAWAALPPEERERRTKGLKAPWSEAPPRSDGRAVTSLAPDAPGIERIE